MKDIHFCATLVTSCTPPSLTVTHSYPPNIVFLFQRKTFSPRKSQKNYGHRRPTSVTSISIRSLQPLPVRPQSQLLLRVNWRCRERGSQTTSVTDCTHSPSSPGLSWRKARTSWPNSSRHRQAACEQAPQVDTLPLKQPNGQKRWDWNPGATRSEGSGLASASSSTEARWPSGQAQGAGAASYHMVGKKRRFVWPERTAAAAVTWPEDSQTVSPLPRPPSECPQRFSGEGLCPRETQGPRSKTEVKLPGDRGTGRLTVAQINISTGPVLRGGHC